jgi:hypothetical protein
MAGKFSVGCHTVGIFTPPTTGLVHLGGGRYNDPARGRPLQPDPIGGPPAVPQTLNRYAATSMPQVPGVAETEADNPSTIRPCNRKEHYTNKKAPSLDVSYQYLFSKLPR